VYYELCGTVLRYTAALYRGATIGPPSDKIKRMSEATIAGLNKVLEVMKPGVSCGEVAEAWAEEIVKGGFPKPYKRAGYSIGVSFPPDWGEGHIVSLSEGDKTILQPGMVFHIPPALRKYGLYGVGVSETVLVTEMGAEILTHLGEELVV